MSAKAGGIYEIVNLVNGKRYVGSSLKLAARWAEHRRLLKSGSHHSRHLQRAWLKHGEKTFECRVLEICGRDVLLEREQFHIKQSAEYNVCPRAGSCLGRKNSPEHVKAVTEAIRNKLRDPEYRAKLSMIIKNSYTPELRKLRAEQVLQRWSNPEYRRSVGAKVSATRLLRKIKPSAEVREKMREARSGIRNPAAIKRVFSIRNDAGEVLTGCPFDLRTQTGFSSSLMSMFLNGKTKVSKGWRLIPTQPVQLSLTF